MKRAVLTFNLKIVANEDCIFVQNHFTMLEANTCIVVPCYNEVIGIVIKEYATFLENSHNNDLLCK
jgi:hypothetical protein